MNKEMYSPVYGCTISDDKYYEDSNETCEKVVHFDFYFDGHI